MEITTKGRYAVRIMVDLARNGEEYISLADIALRQKISQKYLEKIIAMLSKSNLVLSMRGTKGGYKLVKAPSEYSVKEILDATGENTKVASCEGGDRCPMADSCDTMGVWNTLNRLISDYLENISLQDLIDKTYTNAKCK